MEYKNYITEKIFANQKELSPLLSRWHFFERKIVFTNGCFDLLHRGHVDYLAQAADMGEVLVVGLNSDESVRLLKGNDRPLQDQESRATVLAALCFVDAVVLFDQETPLELIKCVQPDILVKGNDYAPEDIVGYDVVKAKGGQIETIALTEGYSTSNLIAKMNTH